ncbi:WXG100 family type VII secretion target [Actinotalea solisilvae]|uniref:WXG100 family type VII secretion target n=1 Tax=Actinotalea solisilvae TaxID=2072922 RepID=UPI0018F1CEB7|nr:WXG100 family type VII secretion target [Actinotalea solisilvae]
MTGTELTIGDQRRAASLVAEATTPIDATLTDLAKTISTSMSGFAGGAAASFIAAVEEWFTVAGQLIPTLHSYADKLVAVDATVAAQEQQQQTAYARLAARLGGMTYE